MKVLCSLLPSAQAVRVLQKERKIERKKDRKKERKKERKAKLMKTEKEKVLSLLSINCAVISSDAFYCTHCFQTTMTTLADIMWREENVAQHGLPAWRQCLAQNHCLTRNNMAWRRMAQHHYPEWYV